MLGQWADRQQHCLWALAGLGQVNVGAVPQRLESRRVPGYAGNRILLGQWRFRQVRELVDTGECGAAMRDVIRPASCDTGNLGAEVVATGYETTA